MAFYKLDTLSLLENKVLMTVNDIMAELQSFGDEKIKTLLLKHGVKEPFLVSRSST
ncbi:hypothetical protein [Mucilaginibacter antarcticus]|uniref:hypothetical protein n=1 Tax=Mucilaginibacter antarcticus TaxID=1855725 RepID=UPI003643C348